MTKEEFIRKLKETRYVKDKVLAIAFRLEGEEKDILEEWAQHLPEKDEFAMIMILPKSWLEQSEVADWAYEMYDKFGRKEREK